MQLTWKPDQDLIYGPVHILTGLATGDHAMVRPSGEPDPQSQYIATAWVNGRFMQHRARTPWGARFALENEIAHRAVFLFGTADVKFVSETAPAMQGPARWSKPIWMI